MIDDSCVKFELSLSFSFTVRLPILHMLTALALCSLESVSLNPGGLPSRASIRDGLKRHPAHVGREWAIDVTPGLLKRLL